jgi:hypothetical protein
MKRFWFRCLSILNAILFWVCFCSVIGFIFIDKIIEWQDKIDEVLYPMTPQEKLVMWTIFNMAHEND